MNDRALRRIFTDSLGITKSDRVLIFTDRPNPDETMDAPESERRESLRHIAAMAAEICRGYAKDIRFLEFPATGGHGMEPPVKLWKLAFGETAVEKLNAARLLKPLIDKKAGPEIIDRAWKIINRHKKSSVSAVMALSNYSTSHTNFRRLLTGACMARYASMPLFDASMLIGPMNVDMSALSKTTRKLAAIINKSEEIEILSPEGSHLKFSRGGRRAMADTGDLRKPGSFGNLPAGEAYLAPLEGTAAGRLVLAWAPTRKLESPLALVIEQGRVVKIEGTEPYRETLERKLSERMENSNIAELGVGTNPRASRPDNILESEKILGTIHMALGDNSAFGGRVSTPYHQDFVFFHPTVTLITKSGRIALLKNGQLLIP